MTTFFSRLRTLRIRALHLAMLLCLGAPVAPALADTSPQSHILAAVHAEDRWKRDRKRDDRSKPLDIMTFMGVERGDTVLDLFTGGGYWAELFARAVGENGWVVAQTNHAYRNFAGRLLESRFKDARVPGVEVIDSEINDLALGSERFDHIFIGLGYHDLYFYADFWPLPGRDYFFAQLYRALKPGGMLTLIDHAALPGTGASAAQSLHRIDEGFALEDWQRAGFTYIGKSDVLRNANDSRKLDVFNDNIRWNTDRFVLKFQKPQ